MFFVIQGSNQDKDLIMYRIKRSAKLKLILYPKSVTETQINNYLQENYNITLDTACKKILDNLVFNLNLQNELIITIKDPELEQLAQLITYGPGTFPGSKILQYVLSP